MSKRSDSKRSPAKKTTTRSRKPAQTIVKIKEKQKKKNSKSKSTAIEGLALRIRHLCDLRGKDFVLANTSIGESTLFAYMKGSSVPGGVALIELALATGCSTDWLLAGIGEPFPTADPATTARQKQVEEIFHSTVATAVQSATTLAAIVDLVSPNCASATEISQAIEALATTIQRLQKMAENADEPSR